jgi:hypothetical protein
MAAKKPQVNKLWLKEESASNAKKKTLKKKMQKNPRQTSYGSKKNWHQKQRKQTQETIAKKPQANKLWLKKKSASKVKKNKIREQLCLNTQGKKSRKIWHQKQRKKEKTSKQQCQQHAPNIMCHPDEVFQIPCN